jgi:hypothetical protein
MRNHVSDETQVVSRNAGTSVGVQPFLVLPRILGSEIIE